MHKITTRAAVITAVLALTLTGCAGQPDAGRKIVRDATIARDITCASDVASTLITKELAKNLPDTLGEVSDVAETLIDNAVKEAQ